MMNKAQAGNRGNGRLMGQVNYDAGIMRYRQLLSRSHHEVPKAEKPAGKALQKQRERKIATSVAALILVLIIGVAGVAQGNCLRLCPGLGGCGAGSYSIESPGPTLTVFANAELAIEAAAWGGGGGSSYAAQCGGFSQFIP